MPRSVVLGISTLFAANLSVFDAHQAKPGLVTKTTSRVQLALIEKENQKWKMYSTDEAVLSDPLFSQ